MPKRKAALVLALGIFVGLYFAFDLGQFLNLQTLKAQQENIATFQSAKPALTVLIFFSIYVLSTAVSLPGAALLTLASGAIFGLMGALVVAGRHLRADITQVLILIGINVVITVLGSAGISWQGHLGGFLGGIAVTLLLVWLRKARPWQWMAVGGVGALALVAMAARVLAG